MLLYLVSTLHPVRILITECRSWARIMVHCQRTMVSGSLQLPPHRACLLGSL